MIIKKNLIALGCAATFSLIATQSMAQTSMQSATSSPVTTSNVSAVDLPAAAPAAPKGRIIYRKATPVTTKNTPYKGAAITLEAPRDYVDQFKKEQQQIEFDKAPKSLAVVTPQMANKMDLVIDAAYTSQKNLNESYSFTENKTGVFLNNEEIDFTKSYVLIAEVEGQDIKLELKDILKTATIGKFDFDAKPYFTKASSPQCASVALYLATKNLNNFLFPLNNYNRKSCKKLILVSDNGTYNADDDLLINVSPMEQKKDHIIKVDITKDGWATKLQDMIYAQPAQMVMINNNLDIFVAPQSSGGQFHYAKVQDIDYSTFKMTSPFVFKTRLAKQLTYRAIVVTNNNGKFKYYPTTVFIEDLAEQFKNTSSQFK